jgi:putative FmdB family regulatory protein
MPIYAYRCDDCGFAKDVLQKISDPVLSVCPSCGKSSFRKQVTAAGFQLKGTGWYVTDFRGGSTPATGTAPSADSGGATAGSSASDSSGGSGSSTPSASASAPAPASTPGSSGDA